jgi:hypothetical protein
MAVPDNPPPRGAIFDTNSNGRFDLVVYDDGLLAVKGTYVCIMVRGAGAGLGSAGTGGAGVAVGSSAGASSYEAKRLAGVLESGREQLVRQEPNFFIARDSILSLTLRKRWHGHSLTIRTEEDPAGRRFEWKPALNKFSQVQEQLAIAFGERLTSQ